jgi:hypothetical protein
MVNRKKEWFDAIDKIALDSGASWSMRDGEIERWTVGDTPTEAEIDAEIIRLQAEYDAQEYARNRASAYDSIGNQLDMLMKDMRDGTTTHQTACEAVKAKFPKPE